MSNDFTFDFVVDEISYLCVFHCIKDGLDFKYMIEIKPSTGSYGCVVISPAQCEGEHWHFTCAGDENAVKYFDKGLLDLIAMEVDKHNLLSLL